MTNYERIKQMSTKEMARLLGSVFVDCDEFTRTIDGKIIFDSFDSIEEWLKARLMIMTKHNPRKYVICGR